MGNTIDSGNELVAEVLAALRGRLPAGWTGSVAAPSKTASAAAVDGVLRIRRKGAAAGTVRVNAQSRVEPKDVDYLAAALRPTADDPVLIAAPYLSPRTQERLRDAGFSYADLTGNIGSN